MAYVNPVIGVPGNIAKVCGITNNTTAVTVGGISASFNIIGECVIVTIPLSAVSGPIVLTTTGGTITVPFTIAASSAPQTTQVVN